MVFINCTHHPAHRWPVEQYNAATAIGPIIELPFPSVYPTAGSEDVHRLACDLLDRFRELSKQHGGATVHLMGEQTLCGAVLREYERQLLQKKLAPDALRFVVTSSRRETRVEQGERRYDWQFVAFREIP